MRGAPDEVLDGMIMLCLYTTGSGHFSLPAPGQDGREWDRSISIERASRRR